MTRNRLSLFLAVLAMFVVAVAGFFLAVQPQLAQAADAHLQRTTVEQTNATSSAELARLRAQAKTLPQMQEQLAALSTAVPADADLPDFITELNATADATGVTVNSYASSDAVAYAPTAGSASTASDESAPSSTPSPTASATASPGATASTAPTAPAEPSVVTDPAITAQNFSVVPVAVAVDGTFDQALAFVKGIQTGKRLFLVTAISSTQASGSDGESSGKSTWMIGGSVYVLDRDAASSPSTSSNG